MDFDTAWDTASVGTQIVAASDDSEPPKDELRRWAVWRSCNFTGTVVEKLDAPRRLIVQLPADDSGQPVFTLHAESKCSISFPAPTLALAEKVAIEKVEKDAETVTSQAVRRTRRQIAIARAHTEVQLLKLHVDTNTLAALDATERAKRFPTLMALVQATGKTLAVVATEIEARLNARVWENAQTEAKLILAHDAIRAATTPKAKIAAAYGVYWPDETPPA